MKGFPGSRPDVALLAGSRAVRGFGAGALSVVFAIDLSTAGYSALAVGIVVGVSIAAAAGWATAAPEVEHRLGRRRLLLLGAASFAVGGTLLWADVASPVTVLVAVGLGGIATGSSDVSPLAAAEQAGIATASAPTDRTSRFAFYNLAGYLGAAAGAVAVVPLATGPASVWPVGTGVHSVPFLLYGILGAGLFGPYLALSDDVGGARPAVPRPLSPESRRPILELSALFAVDAFGGGLIANTLVSAYLVERFHPPLSDIAWVLFGGSVAAGASLLLAVPVARRFGLVRTMVFTHLPSDLLLAAVAFVPSIALAGVVWVLRSTLSQMDVPTRQAYVQQIVRPEERTAAAGYTTAGRSGQALGAPLTGAFLQAAGPWLAGPFVLAGSVKVAYDLAVYRRFGHAADRPEPSPPDLVQNRR